MIRKESSYHQNHEIIFPIIKEKFEYKIKTPHEGKVGNSNCTNSLHSLLHPFANLIIGDAADTPPSDPFFVGLYHTADALEVRRSRYQLLYLGSSSLSSIDCLYESATCKEQAGGPAVVCRSASPMAKSVLVSENPFVFRVFEVRTFFAEEVPLYILHIRGLSFRLLWEEDHVDCRRGISSLLFRKGNPHFKESFC